MSKNSKAIKTCFYCTFAAEVCVCVCALKFGGMNPAPKHWAKSLPLAVLPTWQVIPCSLPQFPLHHLCKGPAVPYMGKNT